RLGIRNPRALQKDDVAAEPIADLAHEPRLSDARFARDRDDRAATREHVAEHALDRRDFLGTSAQSRRRRSGRPGSWAGDRKRRHSLALALQLEPTERLELKVRLDLSCRERANGDTTRMSMGLQPRG